MTDSTPGTGLEAARGIGERLSSRQTWRNLRDMPWARLVTVGFAAAAGVALIAVAVTTEGFLTVANAKAIGSSMAIVGIVAVGMTYIIISGNLFSLSLGTTAAVGAMFFLFTVQFGLPAAIVLTLLLGTAVGALQGTIVGAWGANPIIVTIAVAAILEGLTVWITGGTAVLPPLDGPSLGSLRDPVAGIPVGILYLAAIALAAEFLLQRTRFGREIYLLGDSKPAARAAGVHISRVITGVFAVAGGCAAFAGILLGASSGRGELLLSGNLTFDAFAAAIVGGNAITGGYGSVRRTIVGALIIAILTDILLLRGASTGMQTLVKGALVLVVVVLVHISVDRRAR